MLPQAAISKPLQFQQLCTVLFVVHACRDSHAVLMLWEIYLGQTDGVSGYWGQIRWCTVASALQESNVLHYVCTYDTSLLNPAFECLDALPVTGRPSPHHMVMEGQQLTDLAPNSACLPALIMS